MSPSEQTKRSIEANLKILTLAEKETKRLLERNKLNKLEKCKIDTEIWMGSIHELKYKLQEIMIEKDEPEKE